MNHQYELASTGIVVALFIAFCMLVGGFFLVPSAVRITVIGAAVMFVGWQIVEFILQEFIIIAA